MRNNPLISRSIIRSAPLTRSEGLMPPQNSVIAQVMRRNMKRILKQESPHSPVRDVFDTSHLSHSSDVSEDAESWLLSDPEPES